LICHYLINTNGLLHEQHPTIITMDADKILNWVVGFRIT